MSKTTELKPGEKITVSLDKLSKQTMQMIIRDIAKSKPN